MITCDCPRARHEHGTRVMYVSHKCRCRPCTDAAAEYAQGLRRRHLYGRHNLVDAEPARQHVRDLMSRGMGWKRVARAAGVNTSMMYPLLYGKYLDQPDHPDRRPPRKQIRREYAEAILAVRFDLAAGALVDPTGTRRRIQALVHAGWPIAQIADRTGLDHQRLRETLRGLRLTTLRETRDRVAEFFTTAWHGPDDCVPPASVTRARNLARKRGWLPALAWDDIDDPSETPDVEVLRTTAPRGHGAAAARVDDLEELLRFGCGWDEETIRRAGWKSLDAAERSLNRLGRSDLVAKLRANTRAAALDRHVAPRGRRAS
ncbi:hypothetical protein ACUXNS_000075 [Brevibacterium pityocampae]